VSLFVTSRGRTSFDERIRALRPRRADDAGDAAPTLRRAQSSIPMLRRLLSGSEWAEATALQLQQANVHLRVGEFLLVRVAAAILLFVVTLFVSRMHPVGLVIGLVLGAAGYFVPGLYVQLLRRRRIDKIETQLIELAPMLASALRSGFALQQGMELAAHQLEPPIADELNVFISDVNLGATMEAAMLDMGRRIGSTDFDMLITAILVQRTSGGNLSEVLDQTAETLRERERIRGDLKTLTAQQRLTGTILSAYPIAVGLVLLALMPSLWSVMFTKTLGQVFLGVALGLQFIGFLVMRRVMNIEI
jgi:tight adherence protein B